MQKNMIITLLLSIIIALFAILNASAIPINLIFYKLNVSAALVILISASIGAVIVYSLGTISKLKEKRKLKDSIKDREKLSEENRHLKERILKYELEISNLKLEIENGKKLELDKDEEL